MDPITHGVLGAVAGWAAGGRRLGPRAAVAAGVAGMLPDLDLLLRPISDPALPWELHRHFTHALLFTPVGGLAAALPFLFMRAGAAAGRGSWRLLYLVSCLGYLSHSLLDNATSWGTLWYWPFSTTRIALDFIAIIDPVFSMALLAGLVAALWRRRTAPAVAALLFGLAYLGFGAFQRGRAETALLAAAAQRGDRVDRVRIVPTLANVVLWRGLYTSGGMLHAHAVRTPLTGAARVEPGRSLPLLDATPGSIAAATDPRVSDTLRRFLTLADGYAAMTPDHPGVVGDMRYSLEPGGFAPLWGLRIEPSRPGEEVVWVDLLEGGPSFPERVFSVLESFRR